MCAHIADTQYEFCGPVAEGKPPDMDIEKKATAKAVIVAAIKLAFAYRDGAYKNIRT
jgi:hypothetical protein